MKKLWTVLLGIALGILVIILRKVLNIPEDEVLSYYRNILFIALAVFLVTFAVNFVWQLLFMKKMSALTTILYKEKDADRFIAENEKLLASVKSPINKSMVTINISTGYAHKGDFPKAKEGLLQIPENHMKGINKVIYLHNLSYYHFMMGELSSGAAVFRANRALFQKYEKHPALGASIAVNNIFYHVATREKEQAKILLEEVKSKYTDPRLADDLAALDKLLL